MAYPLLIRLFHGGFVWCCCVALEHELAHSLGEHTCHTLGYSMTCSAAASVQNLAQCIAMHAQLT
jgi:hypothetical protein